MFIQTKLTEKDFINLQFILLYQKLFMKLLTGIGLIFLIGLIYSFLLNSKVSFSQMITPFAILLGLPVLTWFSSKKNYRGNRISETIDYEFDQTNLSIKGQSFNAQLSWNKIYKVTQTRNWILIWQNSQVANAIPKRDIWEGQMADLKTILNENSIRNNL